MAKLMICDRCGKELQVDSCKKAYAARKKYYLFTGYGCDQDKEFHFCPKCWKEVLAYLNGQKKDMT